MIGAAWGWRGVFAALALLGLAVGLCAALMLHETLPPQARSSLRPGAVLRTYAAILADGRFVLAGLSLSAVFVFIFGYVGGAAYSYQTFYDLSPRTFGFVFGGTGVAVFFGAAASAQLVTRFPVERLAVAGVGAIALGALVGGLSVAVGLGLPGVVTGFFIALAGIGMGEAVLMSMALSLRSTAVGASAALLGAVPLLLGAAITPVAAWAAEQGPATWLALLFGIALLALALTLATVRMVARSGVAVVAQH